MKKRTGLLVALCCPETACAAPVAAAAAAVAVEELSNANHSIHDASSMQIFISYSNRGRAFCKKKGLRKVFLSSTTIAAAATAAVALSCMRIKFASAKLSDEVDVCNSTIARHAADFSRLSKRAWHTPDHWCRSRLVLQERRTTTSYSLKVLVKLYTLNILNLLVVSPASKPCFR